AERDAPRGCARDWLPLRCDRDLREPVRSGRSDLRRQPARCGAVAEGGSGPPLRLSEGRGPGWWASGPRGRLGADLARGCRRFVTKKRSETLSKLFSYLQTKDASAASYDETLHQRWMRQPPSRSFRRNGS